jgi:hypothetical protein
MEPGAPCDLYVKIDPPKPTPPSGTCKSNRDCAERSYCVEGSCVKGGTTVFDAPRFLKMQPGVQFPNMQTGVMVSGLQV